MHVSLRAFARDRKVSLAAVQKAIAVGRLSRSVGRDARGHHFIRDLALARREWADDRTKATNDGGRKRAQRAARSAAPHDQAPAETPVIPENGTLVHAQLRVADQRALALELANKRKRGELHDVADCDRKQFEIARLVRARVEGVADRIADLGPAIRARIRAELRQALSVLADELDE